MNVCVPTVIFQGNVCIACLKSVRRYFLMPKLYERLVPYLSFILFRVCVFLLVVVLSNYICRYFLTLMIAYYLLRSIWFWSGLAVVLRTAEWLAVRSTGHSCCQLIWNCIKITRYVNMADMSWNKRSKLQ